MDPADDNPFQNHINDFIERTTDLSLERQALINGLDFSIGHSQKMTQFQSSISNSHDLMINLKNKMAQQMIKETALRHELYDFQINKFYQFVGSSQDFLKEDLLGQQKVKISSLVLKFLQSQFDFTGIQQKSIFIYHVLTTNKLFTRQYFGIVFRILKKNADFHSFKTCPQLCLGIFALKFHKHLKKVNNQACNIDYLVGLLEQFKIYDLIFKIIDLNMENSSNIMCFFRPLMKLIYLLFDLQQVLQLFRSKHHSKSLTQNTLKNSTIITVRKIQDKSINFIPNLIKILATQGHFAQVYTITILCLGSIVQFQSIKSSKIYNFTSLNHFFKDFPTNQCQKQVIDQLSSSKIMDLILKTTESWITNQSSIPNVFNILQFIASEISPADFNQKYIDILHLFPIDSDITSLSNWAHKFIHINKGKGHQQQFSDIFFGSSFIIKILDQMNDKKDDLFMSREGIFHHLIHNKWQVRQFVFRGILCIEVFRICRKHPNKSFLACLQAILSFGLPFGWVNQMMVDFLKENPIQPNEKMEIEE